MTREQILAHFTLIGWELRWDTHDRDNPWVAVQWLPDGRTQIAWVGPDGPRTTTWFGYNRGDAANRFVPTKAVPDPAKCAALCEAIQEVAEEP